MEIESNIFDEILKRPRLPKQVMSWIQEEKRYGKYGQKKYGGVSRRKVFDQEIGKSDGDENWKPGGEKRFKIKYTHIHRLLISKNHKQ